MKCFIARSTVKYGYKDFISFSCSVDRVDTGVAAKMESQRNIALKLLCKVHCSSFFFFVSLFVCLCVCVSFPERIICLAGGENCDGGCLHQDSHYDFGVVFSFLADKPIGNGRANKECDGRFNSKHTER